jgi:hypothetical protein
MNIDDTFDHLKYNIVTDEDGTIFYYNNKNKLHRENDQPAIVWENGTKQWYVNGQLHRENDKPAVIYADGTQYWWVNGIHVKSMIHFVSS